MKAPKDYVICSCQRHSTIAIREVLRLNEIRALAPGYMKSLRLPRTKKRVNVFRAILPGYIFIHQDDLERAETLRSLGVTGDLNKLRNMTSETDLAMRTSFDEIIELATLAEDKDPEDLEPQKPLKIGEKVTINSGPFSDYSGTIEAVSLRDQIGQTVTVLLANRNRLKVSSFLLSRLSR